MSQASQDKIRIWREDPRIFVREVFGVTPDPWQDKVLEAFPHKQRIALLASKGVGKSCLEAWLAWNFLVTRPHPKIAATSISGDNLRDGLWTEMAYWQGKSPLLKNMFVWQKERIFAKDHPETWWMSARQWKKDADANAIGNTLAGLHADYIMFVLDESGDMPPAILASAEAALSSCKEGHIIQAGNPVSHEGALYAASVTGNDIWHMVKINSDPDDPNRSPRVSKQWAQDQIKQFGRDNPWVLVNVFGQFPPSSFNSLIGPEEISQAINRRYKESDYIMSPIVFGIDCARYGDDSSVLFVRQGLRAFEPFQYRNLDGTGGAEITARKWNELSADACFIDDSGGFGSSWIDNLIRLGKDPIGIHFSKKASSDKYYNKRTEMAFECVEWIKRGGWLPNIPELTKALVSTSYGFKGEQLLLEPKEDVKSRLQFSPDHMDALMLTFAMPVDKDIRNPFGNTNKHLVDYNPLAKENTTDNVNQYVYDPRR